MEDALNDKKYYKKLQKNPLNSLKKRIKKLLDFWLDRGVFESDIAFSNIDLNVGSTQLARSYGLVKIHKVDNPLRIIVSEVNAPTYALDKALALLFKRHVPRSPHSIQNSLQLKSELDKLHIPDDYKLVSFDVVSLFTNISFDLIISDMKRKWKFLKSFLPLTRQEFLNGIMLLLNSAYFQFNNQFYKQILGDPMGFCTSPWFAEIVLEY